MSASSHLSSLRVSFALWLCLCLSGCLRKHASSDSVPILYKNQATDEPVLMHLDNEMLETNLARASSMVTDSLLPILESAESPAASRERITDRSTSTRASPAPTADVPPTPWRLRTVIVGIGGISQAAIGPFALGGLMRIRFIFSNSEDPPIP